MTKLDTFPTHDLALSQLEHALNGTYEVDEVGNHTLVNAEFTLEQLLLFYSGYDPALVVEETPEIDLYPREIYSTHDVIHALIGEVRRCREAV